MQPLAPKRLLFDQPYVLLVLTALFWAGNAIAGKMSAGVIPPVTLTFSRWLFASTLLFMLARPHLAEARPLLKTHWKKLALLGALGFGFFNIMLYAALNYTSAINVTIEQSGMPMMILLAMFLIYREPVTGLQLLGVVFSIAGVLVTVARGDLMALVTLDVNIGDALMILAVLAYSGYSVALKSKPPLKWQVFMFSVALAAMLFSLPFAAVEVLAFDKLPVISWKALALLLYVGLFPSLLSQIFFVRAIEMIGASRSGLFINLVPVFGAVLAVLLLGETFHLYHAAGLGLVIFGIGLAEISARRTRH